MRIRLAPAFTFIDVLMVMGLVAILFSFSSINFLRVINKPSLDSAAQRLVADIKGAQNQAMVGDSGSASATTTWGVYIQSNRYTLFRGASYVAGATSNFAVNMDPSIRLATTFSGSTLGFTRRSGEVTSYSGSNNTITVTNTASGRARTITVNRYGALTLN